MIIMGCDKPGCSDAQWQLRAEEISFVIECFGCGDMRRIKYGGKKETFEQKERKISKSFNDSVDRLGEIL